MNDQLYRKQNSKTINKFKISSGSPIAVVGMQQTANQCQPLATLPAREFPCPKHRPMTIGTN